ncbi:hypothetical protein QJS10_CPB17g00639 [Acorus calamus]|uniref:Uncharacterized protein n=1 Tax=Acorus calamus TaxID=4465 RepID=A0AAV9CW30_ACOCL|nr:hypothetical protein QJS10_CPB17g00639 [Acorus calamus]
MESSAAIGTVPVSAPFRLKREASGVGIGSGRKDQGIAGGSGGAVKGGPCGIYSTSKAGWADLSGPSNVRQCLQCGPWARGPCRSVAVVSSDLKSKPGSSVISNGREGRSVVDEEEGVQHSEVAQPREPPRPRLQSIIVGSQNQPQESPVRGVPVGSPVMLRRCVGESVLMAAQGFPKQDWDGASAIRMVGSPASMGDLVDFGPSAARVGEEFPPETYGETSGNVQPVHE